MDKSRNAAKLADTKNGGPKEMQQTQASNSKSQRESLIESAMKIASRDVTGVGELRGNVVLEQGRDARKEEHHSTPIRIEAARKVTMSASARHCEAMRAHLWTRYPGNAMKVILFVGITPHSGASTAAANFAAMVAEDAASKVLLMDVDFRSADKRYMNTKESEGADLSQLLTGSGSAATVCPVPGPSNLYVLPRGKRGSLPLSLFESENFDQLLRTVRNNFRYVVLDGPSLRSHPEGLVLSRKADGVILVIESEATRKRTALWAKEQIEEAGGNLLGVVLNKRKHYIPEWIYRRI